MKLTKWKVMSQDNRRTLHKFAIFPVKIYEGYIHPRNTHEFHKEKSCWIWLESYQVFQWRLDPGNTWYTMAATDKSFIK